MKLLKYTLASTALVATCAFSAAPKAPAPNYPADNSDVVGTWFAYSDVTGPARGGGGGAPGGPGGPGGAGGQGQGGPGGPPGPAPTPGEPTVTYYTQIWQLHADGTVIQSDGAFAGIFARAGQQPMLTGLSSPYYGGWKRNADGSVNIWGIHYEAQSVTEGIEGRVKNLMRFDDSFDPKTGILYHCIRQIPITNGLFDPEKNDPSKLGPAPACPNPNGRGNKATMIRIQ
jgi:hypothetical protein